MKKHLLTGGFAATLLLGACGGESESAEESAEESSEESTEEETTEEQTTKETTEEETTESAEASEGTEAVERDENSSEVENMENGEYEIQMAEVEITDTEILPPNEYTDTGKDQLIIYYNVTSKVTPEESEDTDVSTTNVWMATANATQETDTSIVDLNVGMAPQGEEHQELVNTQSDVIKKDETVPGMTNYELENRENPVVIEFTQGLMGESLGEMEIDVSE